MPLFYSIFVFLGSLTLVIGGSMFLSRALGRLGPRLNIPEQLLGFITALGADSPEISAAVVSMISGQQDVAVGVVFGSNLFNLASLLGVTAVIAGQISLPRAAVLLNGGVGILVTVVAVALVLGAAPPPLVFGLALAILVPYVVLLALRRDSLERLPLPASWKRFVVSAASELEEHAREIQQAEAEDEREGEAGELAPPKRGPNGIERPQGSVLKFALWVLVALVAMVLGSTGLVRSTTSLTAGWLPRGLLGTLVLAVLTGIPNLYTAVRLAQRHRGSAVMTEAMNSNSLNILVGLAIPSLVFGDLTAHTPGGYLDTWWLLLMTVAIVCILAVGRGLNRKMGIGVIAAYLTFVALCIYLA